MYRYFTKRSKFSKTSTTTTLMLLIYCNLFNPQIYNDSKLVGAISEGIRHKQTTIGSI